MSATAGKIVVDGVSGAGEGAERSGEAQFHLRFLQARDPALVGRPFTTGHSSTAAWIDGLRPTPGTPADIAAALTDEACGAEHD
jgi:hypothetical protein